MEIGNPKIALAYHLMLEILIKIDRFIWYAFYILYLDTVCVVFLRRPILKTTKKKRSLN